MEEVEEKLGKIEEYLHTRYYAFILEEIVDFYSRIHDICNRSNTMSELLTYINEQNTRILEAENQVGAQISEDEFESLISDVDNKITQYEQLEKQVIIDTNALYEDVNRCIQNSENDVKNTVVPLSKIEAKALLEKQDQVINDLEQEKSIFENEAKMIHTQILQLQDYNRMNGKPAELSLPSEKQQTKESLLWLYSLKRIISHSVGIVDIRADQSYSFIQFKDNTTLEIDCDKDGNTENARLNTVAYNSAFQTFMNIQSEFTDIVSKCIGMDRTILIKNTLYLLYSINRLQEEIQTIRLKYAVNLNANSIVQISFPNYVTVDVRLPAHYPRTMDKISFSSFTTSDIDKSIVNSLNSILRNKQFFSLSDFVVFVEQSMFNE